MRDAISTRVRLAITLRFIATGDSYRSLEFLTRVSRKTIGNIVPEILNAIYNSMQPLYLKVIGLKTNIPLSCSNYNIFSQMPNTNEEWNKIANDFYKLWQFPNTLGALDGKHIRIIKPAHSGSSFFNYKGFFSIILFALVDARSKFIFIDVGCNGRGSDSTIFKEGYLYNALKNDTLNIPPDRLLTGLKERLPHFFIWDDAFPISKNLMKPYNRNTKLSVAEEIFNYRLCRARMTVKCAFGRLAQRFRIFHHAIEVMPSTVDLIVKTCCVLHNY